MSLCVSQSCTVLRRARAPEINPEACESVVRKEHRQHRRHRMRGSIEKLFIIASQTPLE
jgi:hypothetical protein